MGLIATVIIGLICTEVRSIICTLYICDFGMLGLMVGFVAYVSAPVCSRQSQSVGTHRSTYTKDFTSPPNAIATGTQYARGKYDYFSLLSRAYGEISLLIGFIQDRLIDLQASLDQIGTFQNIRLLTAPKCLFQAESRLLDQRLCWRLCL